MGRKGTTQLLTMIASRLVVYVRSIELGWYWENLYKAIYATNGAYARALGAVDARKIVPLEHFRIACGAPIAQKKHISADTVLERLVAANVLVTAALPGLGQCVMAKPTFETLDSGDEDLVATARSRLIAEGILLDSIKEWLRRLAFGSYNSIKMRAGMEVSAPKVGTFTWGLTAPSYVVGLLTWEKNKVKPGLVVCNVLLSENLHAHHLERFLYKVKSLQALNSGLCDPCRITVFTPFICSTMSRKVVASG